MASENTKKKQLPNNGIALTPKLKRMMNKAIDMFYELAILALTALCFVGAGVAIIQALTNDTSIIVSTVLTGQGIVLSLFYIYLKYKTV